MIIESTVRDAVLADASALFALLEMFVTSYRPDVAVFRENLPQLLDSADLYLLVAEYGGDVVGYVLAFRFLTLYANGPIVEMQELMVHPDYRSQGIGRALVSAVVERAKSSGCVEVTVPTRRAGAYYEKLGFAETASYFKRKLTGDET